MGRIQLTEPLKGFWRTRPRFCAENTVCKISLLSINTFGRANWLSIAELEDTPALYNPWVDYLCSVNERPDRLVCKTAETIQCEICSVNPRLRGAESKIFQQSEWKTKRLGRRGALVKQTQVAQSSTLLLQIHAFTTHVETPTTFHNCVSRARWRSIQSNLFSSFSTKTFQFFDADLFFCRAEYFKTERAQQIIVKGEEV